MSVLRKYKVYCVTDGQFETVNSDSVPTVCPVDAGHTVDTSQTYSEGEVVVEYLVKDYGLDAIYSTSSGAYSRLAFQVVCPDPADYEYTNIEASINIDYYTDSGVTGFLELYNYTNLSSISGSQQNVPNVTVWSNFKSDFFDVSGNEGKSLSLRFARDAGTGNSKVYVEAASIIFRMS